MTIRVVSPQTGQQFVVLKPGKRLVGRALDVKDRVVAFVMDGQHDTIAIPLDSIGKLEVSEHRSRRHLLRGILVGIAGFYGTAELIFWSGCGLDCSNASLLIPAIAGGIATGVMTGRRREAWKTVTAAWLSSQFNGTSAPSVPANLPALGVTP